MKTSQKLLIGSATVAALGAGALGASAHDLPSYQSSVQGLPENSQRPAWKTEAHAALEAGDYSEWKAAHEEHFQEMTSQERFEQLQEFHELLSDGKYEEARRFAKDHNLRPRHGMHRHP